MDRCPNVSDHGLIGDLQTGPLVIPGAPEDVASRRPAAGSPPSAALTHGRPARSPTQARQ